MQIFNAPLPSFLWAQERWASVHNVSPHRSIVEDMDLREDPRRVLARFFRDGDSRGPQGCVEGSTGAPSGGPSNWFVVFRPCAFHVDGAQQGALQCPKWARIRPKIRQTL